MAASISSSVKFFVHMSASVASWSLVQRLPIDLYLSKSLRSILWSGPHRRKSIAAVGVFHFPDVFVEPLHDRLDEGILVGGRPIYLMRVSEGSLPSSFSRQCQQELRHFALVSAAFLNEFSPDDNPTVTVLALSKTGQIQTQTLEI